LKKEKEESLEQLRVAQKEKNDIQAKFEQNHARIQEEKYKLLADHIAIKEAVTKELFSMSDLTQEEEESIDIQVVKIT
jgi:hypothetical protein